MAPSFALSSPSIKLYTTFILVVFAFSTTASHPCKETKMSVFFQDVATGPNATVVAVAGIPGTTPGFLQYGSVFVSDDPITETIDKNSPEIARGQGIYVTSSKDGLSTHLSVSIAFTNREYNGSTLELQGNSFQLADVREYAIVGGTGRFRFVKGYATLDTVFFDPSILYSVIRCNLTIRYD
ncbi:OLC1v1005512C1 [Oldenlandia corymbosa var. corymbosa]|uniref:Dirigent protein n=1 Tax=Oldenlandia corymbosa var. corymbosa TaxID=529605 RepID=A0AAV1DFB1_OLDCO|nr:OLC1v1005512C1 [Oldenlandia corymbosa var. corymbosa]